MIKILNEEVNDRREEYYKYLEDHINGVKKSFEVLFPILKENNEFTNYELEELKFQIENHDKSKYDKYEFYPYLHHFYPSEIENDDKELYDKAWNHHQKFNPHHWQYWILIKDEGILEPLSMPEKYIIEMLCDWQSFSYKNPESTAWKWYYDNKDKMMLHNDTIKIIEKYIKCFK